MSRSIDISEINVSIPDRYDHVPNELGDGTVDDIVDEATTLSLQYIEQDLGEDPLNFVFPSGKKGKKLVLNNPGFQYLSESVPRLRAWCDENVAGSRIATIYEPESAMLEDGDGLGEGGTRLLQKLKIARAVRRRKKFGVQYLVERALGGGERWLNSPSGNNIPVLEAAAALPRERQPGLITAVDYSFVDLINSQYLAVQMGLSGIAREYRWRDLRQGLIERQPVKRSIVSLMFALQRQPVISGDADLKLESYDRVKVDGFWEYFLDDERLSSQLKEYLEVVKPGGELVFDDTRETRPQPHFTRAVLGWLAMADRDLDRLHDRVLMPNRDAIDEARCYNLDDVFRVVILRKR
jgi:hypothetical protein